MKSKYVYFRQVDVCMYVSGRYEQVHTDIEYTKKYRHILNIERSTYTY